MSVQRGRTTHQSENLSLLDRGAGGSDLVVLRKFDPTSAARELTLRLQDVSQRVAKLEEAQTVSQSVLEAVVSV